MPVNVETVETAESAARALSNNAGARILGGGTLVMSRINSGDPNIKTLYRVNDPALKIINEGGSEVELGAAVTMSEILARDGLSFLHDAAKTVGGPAIRNMATIGGNLFARAPYGDFATLLLALDAEVKLADRRSHPVDELFRAAGTRSLPMIQSVRIRRPDAGSVQFFKMSRMKPRGPAIVSLGVWLERSAGRVREARIALGGVQDRPCLSNGSGRALQGEMLNAASIEKAVSRSLEGITPRTDAIASDWYRGEMVQVQLHRILTKMAGE